jgi:hypothetical protein
MNNPPLRMVILLAVFWVAGSLLLAAESPSTPKPAATATKPASDVPAADKPADKSADKTADKDAGKKAEGDTKTDAKADAKADAKEPGKGSIADQAEAALKAAAEADPGSTVPKDAPKSEAEDDTQAPPSGSAGKGPSPQRFVPTEQVRADFDVSFPIDI